MDYWDVLGQAFDKVDIYNGPDVFFAGFSPLSEPEKHLLAAHWLQSEVNNGGFDQFFRNPTGVLAPEAVDGFRAMGRSDIADVIAAAVARFGDQYPRDREQRNTAIDAMPGDGSNAYMGRGLCFSDLDDRFYHLLPDFYALADAYANSHRNKPG